MSPTAEELAAALVIALSSALGEGLRIDNLVRLSAGASRETWSFDAVAGGDTHELILQRARSGATQADARVDEVALLRLARAGGVRVPEVIVSAEGDNPIRAPFTISRRLAGESIARRILRDDDFAVARDRFVADCARELVAIHALDHEAMVGRLSADDDVVAAQRVAYESFDDPHPVFDLALRWLDQNRPAARPAGIVHGDFRLGNILIDHDGITAVLDWELSHIGDPVSDLGWLVSRAWRFGEPGEVGGMGSRRQLVDAYAEAGGAEIPLDELRWWEGLATLRWGIICMFMVDDHRRGRTASVERATIGRRVVESEYDVMLLLLPELALAR